MDWMWICSYGIRGPVYLKDKNGLVAQYDQSGGVVFDSGKSNNFIWLVTCFLADRIFMAYIKQLNSQ